MNSVRNLANLVARKPLSLILLFALLARLLLLDTSYVFWDEAEYLMDARLIATGDTNYDTMSYRPPLVPLLLAPFYRDEFLARALFVLINSMSVLFAYLLARRLSERAGLIAAALLAIMPFHLLFSHYLMTDSIAMLLSMACVHFYLGSKPWHAYAGGAMLSLAILCKFTSLAVLPVILLIFLYNDIPSRHIPGSLGLAFVLFVPYLIYNQVAFGHPLFAFLNGFRIINIPEPPSIAGIAFMLFDMLNIVLFIVFFIGAYKALSRRNRTGVIMFIWFLLMLLIFIVLVQRGVDKPPGIEWLSERFLLPAVPPFFALVAYGLSRLKPMVAALIVLIALFAWFPAYSRLLVPAIDHEGGLRHVTKEMGTYLSDVDAAIYCKGNCPPVAYYSGKDVQIIYGGEEVGDGIIVLFNDPKQGILEFKKNSSKSALYLTSDLR